MKRIIFFDGVCNLCNGFVDFVVKRARPNTFQFSSLQSNYAKLELPNHSESLDTIVLKEDEKTFTESDAVLRIFFELGGWWNILAMMLSVFPKIFRDGIYRIIARNRYKLFGQKKTCRIPSVDEKKLFLE